MLLYLDNGFVEVCFDPAADLVADGAAAGEEKDTERAARPLSVARLRASPGSFNSRIAAWNNDISWSAGPALPSTALRQRESACAVLSRFRRAERPHARPSGAILH